MRVHASFPADAVAERSDDFDEGSCMSISDEVDSGDTIKLSKPVKISRGISKAHLNNTLSAFAEKITESLSVNIKSTKESLESKLSDVQASISQISTLVQQNNADIDQLKSSIVNIDDNISKHGKCIASLEQAVTNCEDNVAVIQQELADLKNDNEAKVSEAAKLAISKVSSSHIEITYSESCDRLRRFKNLVFFKIPENNDKDQSVTDKQVIMGHLRKSKAFDDSNVSEVRLGQYKSNSVCPLLVTLQSQDDFMAILRNKNKFYKDIAVSSDKTKAQREYLSALWKQD